MLAPELTKLENQHQNLLKDLFGSIKKFIIFPSMLEHKLIILEYNYWEHFKYAKDIAMVLPHGHPIRIDVETKLNEYVKEINELKIKIKVGKS